MSSNEWKEVRLGDVANVLSGYAFKSKDFCDGGIPIIKIKNITPPYVTLDDVQYVSKELAEEKSRYKLKYNDVLISLTGSNVNQFASAVGKVGRIKINKSMMLNQRVGKFEIIDESIYNLDFLYYLVSTEEMHYKLALNAGGAANQANISPSMIKNVNLPCPPISEQNAIAATLSCIDDKIELNNKINHNLEQQAQAIFKAWFVDFELNAGKQPLEWKEFPLGELVQSIDNRGKTPPLASHHTEYPIIDVKALSGAQRVIDYNNCTKYIEFETYNSWFRNGHPQPFDILLSTVGSLAEMKLFLGTRGCIAQNVVGLRSKKPLSLYLYQYLQYIKGDLISYNIGSVQPSIKVTHIIKHPVLVPTRDVLEQFDKIVNSITKKIYENHCQNERLATMRDIILPRLMSGELSVAEL